MILYKKEPVPMLMHNIMMLDDSSTGGVVYVSKATYDQALMLWSRFEGDVNALFKFIKVPKETWKEIPGLFDSMKKLKDILPEPINMLVPFLKLLYDNKGLDFTDAPIEFIYGVLHQMSQLLDFNSVTLVPMEVSAKISIPTVLLKGYEQSWEDICETLDDKAVLYYSTQPTTGVVPVPYPAIEQPATAMSMKYFQQPEVVEQAKVNNETAPVAQSSPKEDSGEVTVEGEGDLSHLGDILNSDKAPAPFDFTAFIDPDYKDADGNVVGAVPTSDDKKSGSSGNDSAYPKAASALLDEFGELD